MQRDMKVGLALGVLLIGVVGALFFRRDTEHAPDEPPVLEDSETLDEVIAEKPNGPYMTSPEDFAGEPEVKKPADNQAKTAKTDDAFQIPEFLTRDDEQTQRDFLANRKPTAPDPINTSSPVGFPSKKGKTPAPAPTPSHNHTTPSHNHDWEVVRKPQVARGTPEPAAPRAKPEIISVEPDYASPAPTGVTHVVKAGDTLTGLAARYLGDRSRYLEIYEANKHVLKSPHQLTEGVRLNIPGARETAPIEEPAAPRKVEPVASRPKLPSIAVEEPTDLIDLEPETPAEPPAARTSALPTASNARSAKPSAPRTYRVERGDTLERIALRFYGKRSKANEIFDANRRSMSSPESMREGMQIVLP